MCVLPLETNISLRSQLVDINIFQVVFTLKMRVSLSSETLYPITSLHGVTIQKISARIFIPVETRNLV